LNQRNTLSEKLNKDKEAIEKNQTEILKLKNTLSEIKNVIARKSKQKKELVSPKTDYLKIYS
jgi:hypothetical protein